MTIEDDPYGPSEGIYRDIKHNGEYHYSIVKHHLTLKEAYKYFGCRIIYKILFRKKFPFIRIRKFLKGQHIIKFYTEM